MPLSITDLFKKATRDDVMSTLLQICTDLELAVTAWQSGQPVRTILTVTAQKISDTITANIEFIKGGFLDSADGDWLTLLALVLYRVPRLPATYANSATFTITNTSDANVDVDAEELVFAHSVTGKTYRNTEALTLVPGANTDIAIRATESGSSSNAAPGKITVLAHPDLTCTNPDAVLADDEETDPELRTRCREKLSALSPNGPPGIYAFIAKTPDYSATTQRITRVAEVTDMVTGAIAVYLATASGAPSGGDVDIVDAAFDRWATPIATLAVATAAAEVAIDVTYHVWVKDTSLTSAEIQTAIEDALTAYLKTVRIGGDIIDPDPDGKVRVGILELVIGTAVEGTIKVEVTTPTDDVTFAEGEVPVLGTVTPTVTVIP